MTRLFHLAAAILLAEALGVMALPNVTVVPLGNSNCQKWPSWINTPVADRTGTFVFRVDQADDDAVDGLPTGFRTFNYSSGYHQDKVYVDLRRSGRFTRTVYRCWDGAVRVGVSDNLPPLSVSKDYLNAVLTTAEGYQLEPYAHEIGGVLQPGVFLGAQNQTTWGFTWTSPESCGELDSYDVMLQGLPLDPTVEHHAAAVPEFLGFMRVIGY